MVIRIQKKQSYNGHGGFVLSWITTSLNSFGGKVFRLGLTLACILIPQFALCLRLYIKSNIKTGSCGFQSCIQNFINIVSTIIGWFCARVCIM